MRIATGEISCARRMLNPPSTKARSWAWYSSRANGAEKNDVQ